MEPKTLVLQYLDEAHALETALATNLRAHMTMTPDGSYRGLLQKHLKETQDQVEAIERRRGELGENGGRGIVAAGAGLVRDVIGQALVLTKGPLDAVRTTNTNERMLKNAKDECATEALEIATYDALEAAAKAAGDATTARLAADHRATEERMLADLRAEIPRLAVNTVEDRTDGSAVPVTSPQRSTKPTSAPRKRSTKATGTRARAKSTAASSRSTKPSGSGRSNSSSKASKSSGSTRATKSSTSRGSSGRATSGGSKSGSTASRSKASSAKTGSSSKSTAGAKSS